MPDKKISQLTSLAQGDIATTTDVLAIVDTSATETKKATPAAIVGAAAAAGLTNVDINSGAIDGTTIGANSAAAGTFTNLTASGTVSFSGATVSNGGSVTTVDINGGTIDGASVGASSASSGAFTTLSASGNVTLSGGTANGVLYLNGSKVATSGSALTFDGTDFKMPNGGSMLLGASASGASLLLINGTAAAQRLVLGTSGTDAVINATRTSGTSPDLLFQLEASEQMRLTSTGLGIGTSSPTYKLHLVGKQLIEKSGAGYEAAMLSFATITETGAIYRMGMASGGAFIIGRSDTATTNLTLDVSGNLGIGTASPGVKLDVAGEIRSLVSGGTPAVYLNNGSTQHSIQNNSGAFTFYNSGVERMRLDSSGNLGLGVTPSAWASTLVKAFQIADNGCSISSFTTGNTSNKFLNLNNNAYYDAVGWKYIASSVATARYELQNGEHRWYNAPSGTAGNAISFTQAATLDANGNFMVGLTSSTHRLQAEVASGADRDIFMASVAGASNGFRVQWVHSTSKIHVNIQNLPTSSAGLPAGTLWNDSGTLKVA